MSQCFFISRGWRTFQSQSNNLLGRYLREDIPDLGTSYPTLEVVENQRLVDKGIIITSGSISAGIDMRLHLVSKTHGLELAKKQLNKWSLTGQKTHDKRVQRACLTGSTDDARQGRSMQYLALVPYFMSLTGVGLSYVGILPALKGWVLTALGVLSGLGLAVTVVFAGRSDLLWAAALAALPSMVAIPMVINDLRYPRINDVATNVEDPPAFVAALQAAPNMGRDMSFPEKNGPIIREAYPNVRPLTLDEPLEQAFQRIETLAKIQPGWVITRCDNKAHTLEGEATTPFFRFINDFIIHVSDQKGKARINMRSKSRDGLVDAGTNAKRIQHFFEQLTKFKATGEPHVER